MILPGSGRVALSQNRVNLFVRNIEAAELVFGEESGSAQAKHFPVQQEAQPGDFREQMFPAGTGARCVRQRGGR